MVNYVMRLLAGIWLFFSSRVRYARHRQRIKMLIANGLVIGKNVTIEPGVDIDWEYPYLISIGDNCSIGQGSHILAHDATTFKFTDGHTSLDRVEIRENCFIGRNVIILPGVTIGPNVLVAAGSVVNKDIPPNSCVVGVPARFYARFDELMARHQEWIGEGRVFGFDELHQGLDEEVKDKVRQSVQQGVSYVRGFPGRYPFTFNGHSR